MTQKRHEKSALATRWLRASLVPLLLTGFASPVLHAEDELPSISPSVSQSNGETKVYYENDTRMRGKDATGNRVGLSKFRNTLKAEHKRDLGNGWAFKGIFRGTYDGVYDLNDDEYGKNAGGPINVTEMSGLSFGMGVPGATPTSVPYGSSFVGPGIGFVANIDQIAFLGGPPTGAFSGQQNFNLASNPNQGLHHLGQRWNTSYSGTDFGNPGFGNLDLPVPVRPCDVDRRGCADFGGYGDLTSNALKAPEFNGRMDFIREFYAQKTWDLADGKQFNIKVGKQQVVWGRSDLFRVLDVVNPLDFSRNSIYDEFEDIRIPMWILQGNYRMGASDSLSERNVQVVWNFDQFRANNLGQCGTPNAVLDAGCFFRAAKSAWDYGATIGNLAPVGLLGGPYNPAGVAVTVPSHQAGIRNVELPNWSLKNTQIGSRFEGVSKDGTIAFSVNGLIGRSQMPSLRTIRPSALAFDMYFPRISVLGGSMDFNVEALNTTVRLEGAMTHGEELTDTSQASATSRHRIWRSVIGLDRATQIDWINPERTTLISAQFFWQHIVGFNETSIPNNGAFGYPLGGSSVKTGTVGWKDNHLFTLLISAQYMQDRLNPQLIFARDIQARANLIAPSVTFLYTDKLKFKVGANYKWLTGNMDRYQFIDGRGLSGTLSASGQLPGAPIDTGIGGIEALGRFKAGIIGTAVKEDEIFFNMQYQF
ncbi:MAG: DUF1302 family protein [Rugosibacter sp.]|jgi:hypothetical protein|nr:DUF1302 family protein [Rugosibacter sp.]MDO9272093.1 DUF1302 family protein [Rugosibacter sp.]